MRRRAAVGLVAILVPILVPILAAPCARAQGRAGPGGGLAVVGVLGNSGEQGATLIRTTRRGVGGVVVDDSGTLWLGAGDAINRVTLEGRLIERFPIALEWGEWVSGKGFGSLDGTLYFSCADDRRVEHLFALPMRPGATAARLPLSLPPRRDGRLRVAPEPLRGKLVLGLDEQDRPGEVSVFLYAPGSGTLTRSFTVPLPDLFGLAVDAAAGWIYVGGGRAATVVDLQGRPVSSDFPAPVPQLPAIPTVFSGALSLADGAAWRAGVYGFVARLDRLTRGAPGIVDRWDSALGEVSQVAGVGRGLLAFTRDEPADAFLGRWVPGAVQLSLFRRIGSLPAIRAVGLSEDGWVTVADEVEGLYPVQHWWRWEDDARAMPAVTDSSSAVAGGVFIPGSDSFVGVNQRGRLLFFRPRWGDQTGTLTALPPEARPVAFAYQAVPGQRTGRLLYVDGAARGIFAVGYDGPGLHTAGDHWQPVALAGVALEEPGDLVALTDGRLVIADRGRILVLEPSGSGYRLEAERRGWGRGPDDQLGGHVRLAIDGPWMLVSDTDRARVLWLDWQRWRKLGQLGVTDRAGDDLAHVDRPGSVALRAGRAVVADTGNQRVLRLVVRGVGESVPRRVAGSALPSK